MPTDNEKTNAALARTSRRVRGQTTLGRLEALQAEKTRWLRRATFARNKLAGIRAEIEAIATDCAESKFDAELASVAARTTSFPHPIKGEIPV